ncbi:MAG TPA: hypothetical protein VMG12_20925, partial [Polyangiaceae bacterium]|nr:hypothetical protein [Polyangiaceae bacterium]
MGGRREFRISRARSLLRAALGFLAALLLTTLLAAEDRPRLVVYLHTAIRARALESALQHELPA